MHKGLTAFIIVAGIALLSTTILFMKKSADEAHKVSDSIQEEFKRVNESLKQSDDNIDSANKQLLDSLNIKLKK